ncbi:Signal transduction histidine kinase [Chitinophaga sp. CF118]|uniref:ligand-binding sensor domain-containing protein n=1 Tax=Chitinophaga sp. CF118 TaxID=1884367 RepID=UPI0008F272BD|nr:two-component regulator propeller domain-containing protein [Chitinophaga sp. CF118]SFE51756.1 Signal transduction histidine kinase [Chitinophaga sp. CF118]
MLTYPLRHLVLIFVYLLSCFPSSGQISLSGYSITNYNSDNALPQNSINSIAFDKNGFLWLATRMGLVRFDGENFREYNTENTSALVNNEHFLPLTAPDPDKTLILPKDDSFHILTVSDDYQIETDSIHSGLLHSFNTSNCHLFDFTNIYKKQVLENKTGRYKELFAKLSSSKTLITISEKQAYLKVGKDCYFLDENAGSITVLPEITAHKDKLQFAVGNIFCYVDDDNHMYAYKEGVLQRKITTGNKLHQFFVQATMPGSDLEQASLKILRDPSHTFMIRKDSILTLQIVNNILDCEILVANSSITDIECMIYDEDYQTIYIGTITHGLYILKKQEFERLFLTGPKININYGEAQIELPGGRILTGAGIMNRGNKGNWVFPSTRTITRWALLKASDGTIWYSESDSLKRTDVDLHPSVTVSYLGESLTGIVERENKEIIYSTFHKLFRRNAKEETILLDHPGLLQNARIQTIREATAGNIWIGTAKGIFVYELSRRRLRKLSLLNMDVSIIDVAKDSSIWIGTYGQGFYKFYKNHFIRMPVDVRKHLLIAHCFMEDKRGYFWIPTDRGLFRVAKKELDDYASGTNTNVFYYYIDKSHGFTTNEFNGSSTPCGIETKDGRFSLPSIDGYVQFHPDSVHINLPDKAIFVDEVMADDKKIFLKDNLVQIQDFNRLVFEISSPYFGNRINLHLEYSIKELGGKWYPVNEDGRLIITKLAKGHYTLTIRRRDSDTHYKTIQLTILPYWYETAWFRWLTGCLVIGAFLSFFRVRYNSQVKRAELLEQKVAERTQELSITNKDLNLSKLHLSDSNRVKEKMISIILHDFRSPLRFLQLLARHIHGNFREVSEQELATLLLKFQTATTDLYDFAQEFLIWTNAQKEDFIINREKVALWEITNDIISLYSVGANINRNVFINLIPGNLTLTTDANLLKLIIRNLADNANKYTADGEIRIEAIQSDSNLQIIMTDTGQSMNKELIERILNNTYNPADANQGWGYKIITELLIRLGGILSIDTSTGQGNKITITFREDK